MNHQPIIPPQLNKNTLIIKGFFTIWDFVYVFIVGTLSTLTGWSLSAIGWMFQILIAMVMMLFLCSFLIPIRKKRLYTYIYLFIKFCFSNKKFKEKSINNPKLLIPYKKIVEDFIYTGKEYIGAIKLQGFNLTNLALDEQNFKIEQLRQMFKLIDSEISLVKLEAPLYFKQNKQFLKTYKNNYQDKNWSKQQVEARKNQIKAYLKLFDDQGPLSQQQLEKQYYLLIYSKTLKDIKKWTNLASEKAFNANLSPQKMNYYQLVNIIKQILNPYVFDFTKKQIDEHKQDLSSLLKFANVQFKSDYFIANRQYFYQIHAISNLPVFPSRSWALPLMDSDSAVIININPVKNHALKQRLSKSIINLSTNMATASKKDFVGKKEHEHKLNIYQELVEQIGYGIETIKKMNIFIMHYGQSKQELLNKFKHLQNILKANEMQSDRLIFEQIEAYSAFLPKSSNPFDQKFAYEIPTLSLAEAFPFVTSALKDQNGCYLGENLIGEPIVLDQFKKVLEDKQRKNHNMMIIGQTGSGKTTLVKKLLNFHGALYRKIIVIDPEREYKSWCEYYDGSWVDVGNSINGRLNPLQIFGTINEENEIITNEATISHHLQFLENWWAILFPDLPANELRYFSQQLGNLYRHVLPKKGDVTKLSVLDYPTFDDFIDFLNDNFDDKVEYIKLKTLLENEFAGVGKFKTLYNNHSSIKTNDNLINVFDINSLIEKGNPHIINAQLYLLTSFIANEIKDNGFNDQNEIVILIDEAHLLIDVNKPIVLDFIFQMVKRIRKRFGGIILVTQNPDDFLGNDEIRKKTMAIINNLQYTFIMSLSPKNLQDVNLLYKSIGGLSEPQQNFIAHSQTGDALLINGNFERHEVSVKVSEAELLAFNNRKSK